MISATIISLNEEDKIAKAIESVIGLADEVIVIDCGSNDKTVEIAKKLEAKVYHREFDNFANQKNYALSKVTGDWILSLDADEQISPALAKEIKKAIESKEYVGYLISRKNFILGKEIKHSRWSPDRHIWLWKKEFGEWVGDVHEEVKVEGKVGTLSESKIHISHKTIDSFLKANNLYSSLEAESLFASGVKYSFWRMLWDCAFEFFIRYFYKRGFLDGSRGFVLAYIMGIYKLTVWVKIWELQKKIK